MQHLEIRLATYFDIYDQPQFIHGCSIDDITKLKKLYDVFWLEISKVDSTLEIDFLSAIAENKRVFNVADKIIRVCNLDSSGIDLALMAALVHSYEDADGKPHKGYIAEMHFKEKVKPLDDDDSSTGINSTSWEEYYYATLNNLAKSEGSLEKAQNLIANYPQDMIEGYLITHFNQIKKQIESDPNNEAATRQRYKKMFNEAFGKKKTKGIENEVTQETKESLTANNG